jgi:hypothetical protein
VRVCARACEIKRVQEEERVGKRRRDRSREGVKVFQVWGIRFALPAVAADMPNHCVCVCVYTQTHRHTNTQTHTIQTLVPERLAGSKRGLVQGGVWFRV